MHRPRLFGWSPLILLPLGLPLLAVLLTAPAIVGCGGAATPDGTPGGLPVAASNTAFDAAVGGGAGVEPSVATREGWFYEGAR